MRFIPILSKDLEKFLEKNVVLIGKIVSVNYERKYTKVILLDKYGYVACLIFEPINIEEFKTAIILGKVRKFKEDIAVYARRIIFIDGKEEIFWRKRFLDLLKRKNKRKVEKVEKKEKIFIEENDDEKLRNKILEIIKDLDEGNGVSLQTLLDILNIDEDKLKIIIEDLMMRGEIYESSPNRYKVL